MISGVNLILSKFLGKNKQDWKQSSPACCIKSKQKLINKFRWEKCGTRSTRGFRESVKVYKQCKKWRN